VKLSTNCGFAAANNAGIDWLEGCGQHFDYYWFLNNDTRVDRDALGALLARSRRPDNAGIYGSVVLDEQEPHLVQALGGGHYRGLTAQARHIGEGRVSNETWNTAAVERQLSYIYGASMLVSRGFLTRVGPMCEDYFLYNEELDWAFRGRAKGFTLGFADGSIVYHKGGASFARASGAKHDGRVRNFVSVYYLTRGAVIATWRWYPWALPCVLATRWGKCFQRFLCGQRSGARATALALLAPWRLLLPEDLATAPGRARGPGLG
jgi:GT2 family glycosyltransferase